MNKEEILRQIDNIKAKVDELFSNGKIEEVQTRDEINNPLNCLRDNIILESNNANNRINNLKNDIRELHVTFKIVKDIIENI